MFIWTFHFKRLFHLHSAELPAWEQKSSLIVTDKVLSRSDQSAERNWPQRKKPRDIKNSKRNQATHHFVKPWTGTESSLQSDSKKGREAVVYQHFLYLTVVCAFCGWTVSSVWPENRGDANLVVLIPELSTAHLTNKITRNVRNEMSLLKLISLPCFLFNLETSQWHKVAVLLFFE